MVELIIGSRAAGINLSGGILNPVSRESHGYELSAATVPDWKRGRAGARRAGHRLHEITWKGNQNELTLFIQVQEKGRTAMFSRRALTSYLAAVIIVLAILTGIRWLIAGEAGAGKTLIFCLGFLFGMIAMYIALHVYRDDIWPWLSSWRKRLS
jgi:hypothetical protein